MNNNQNLSNNLDDIGRLMGSATGEIYVLARRVKEMPEGEQFQLNESLKGLLRGVAADLMLMTQDHIIVNVDSGYKHEEIR